MAMSEECEWKSRANLLVEEIDPNLSILDQLCEKIVDEPNYADELGMQLSKFLRLKDNKWLYQLLIDECTNKNLISE